MTERLDPSATPNPSRTRRSVGDRAERNVAGYTVALYVLVGIAPLVAIALTSTTGTAFAMWFYALTLVVLGVVAMAIAPAQRPDEAVRRTRLRTASAGARRRPRAVVTWFYDRRIVGLFNK